MAFFNTMKFLYAPIFLFFQTSETPAATSILTDLLKKFVLVIPNLFAAAAVFGIGYFLSHFLGKIIALALEKVGIDRLAAKLNEIDMFRKSEIRIKPSAVIAKMIGYVLLLIFTIAATDLLGMPAVSQLMSDLINYIPSLFSALLVMALGLIFADMVKGLAETALASLGIPSAKILASVVFFFLFITIAVSALGQAKIDTSLISNNFTVIIAAFCGAFAVGYGFASRDLMANLLSGYYNRTKIRRGDLIGIDGVRGEVVATDSATITLWTGDHHIVIPMSRLATEKFEVFHRPPSDTARIEEGESLKK